MNVTPLTLDLQTVEFTDEQIFQLYLSNRDLRFERHANKDLIVISPTRREAENLNGRVIQQLFNWIDRGGNGVAFDSSIGYKLPNGVNRSPDISWIPQQLWEALTQEQKYRFVPLCPNFVIELLSPGDSLPETQERMREYQQHGTRLGWLIDYRQRRVEIYRQEEAVEVVAFPHSLSGEDILSGFVLDLEKIW
ncbi:MAG: Uma2 family endonuclease [Okeania sp. SIO2D1]|nr:Uma2 family endonuclease [Okeania sp. SIO2D1]